MIAWRRPTGVWRAARGRGAEVSVVVWLGLAAFVGLGLPEATLGVTWPSIRADFGQPLPAVGWLLVAITVGYLPASAVSGRLAARVGAGWMLAGASAVFATSMAIYLTAPSLPYLVVGSLLGGVAAGTIDPGINTHFALRHSTRSMNLLHASFGIGATLGPFIATAVIGFGGSWRVPYALYLVVHVVLMGGFVSTRRRWSTPPRQVPAAAADGSAMGEGPLDGPRSQLLVGLSFLTFFVYTGLEVGAGVLAFTLLSESRGMAAGPAGLWVTAYWAGLTIGRAGWGALGARYDPGQIVRVSAWGAVGASLLVAIDPWGAGAVGLSMLGVSLAGIFPSLVLLTPRRVGSDRTANIMGLQFSIAAIGASGVPALVTVLAETNLERIGWALLLLAVVVTILDAVISRLAGDR